MLRKINLKKFHPAMLVLSILFLIFGYGIEVLIFLLALCIHEASHAFVAKFFGYKLSNFYLMPYGACLSYKDCVFLEREEILIAIAGPLSNFIMCILCLAIWWLFPVSYNFTLYFFESNFYLALFNFLPCYPLDCGRIIKAIIKNKFGNKIATKTIKVISYIFSFLFLILFVISCFVKINFNLLLISVLLFLGIFDTIFQGKYEKYYTNKDEMLNKGISVKSIAISGNFTLLKASKKLSNTKYNMFYVVINGKLNLISENSLSKLLQKYNPSTKFNEIFT